MRTRKYKPTTKDRIALRKWKKGKSIGFTMRSSLKAKGLIPRANGTYRVSNKYKQFYFFFNAFNVFFLHGSTTSASAYLYA